MCAIPDAMARASLEALLADCTPHEVAAVRATLRLGRLRHAGAVIAACRGAADGPVAPLFDAWLATLPALATPETHAQAGLLDTWLSTWLTRAARRGLSLPWRSLCSNSSSPR